MRSLLPMAVVLLLPPAASAQQSKARDYEVKAGFVVKFTQYTVWPSNTFASSRSPVLIGVLGQESLIKQLEKEAAGLVSARPVEIRRLGSVEEAARCQVVFISESASQIEAEWLDAMKGKPVLTVGETDQTIEHGGVMRFVIRNKNLQFEASLIAAAANRLELNEGMLRVASRVYKRPRAK